MMGTKRDPGLFDCRDQAMPDEPFFTLLARDPSFARLVRAWADEREAAVRCGDRPREDLEQIREARAIATEGEAWRAGNLYRWRVISGPCAGTQPGLPAGVVIWSEVSDPKKW